MYWNVHHIGSSGGEQLKCFLWVFRFYKMILGFSSGLHAARSVGVVCPSYALHPVS